MRRPGNLSGFEGLTSRAQRRSLLNSFGDLGGKYFAPLPGAPPGKKVLDSAINSRTKKYYEQDTRCPEGETMKSIPCVGADCDPGEMEDDCVDDPFYLEFPDKDYEYCRDVKKDPAWRLVPRSIIQDYCNRQDMDEAPDAKKDAAPATPSSAAAPTAAAPDDTSDLQAELESLEAEEAFTASMPAPAIMPIASTYTGGIPTTIYPSRATKSAPTSEQKIAEMVSAHQEQKAMARAGRPPPPIMLPPVAMGPPPAVGGIQGLLARIRVALFGTPSGSGFGQADKTFDKKNLLLLAATLGAVYYVYSNK